MRRDTIGVAMPVAFRLPRLKAVVEVLPADALDQPCAHCRTVGLVSKAAATDRHAFFAVGRKRRQLNDVSGRMDRIELRQRHVSERFADKLDQLVVHDKRAVATACINERQQPFPRPCRERADGHKLVENGADCAPNRLVPQEVFDLPGNPVEIIRLLALLTLVCAPRLAVRNRHGIQLPSLSCRRPVGLVPPGVFFSGIRRLRARAYRIRQQMDIARAADARAQRELELKLEQDRRAAELEAIKRQRLGLETDLYGRQIENAGALGSDLGNLYRQRYIDAVMTPDNTRYGPQLPFEERRKHIPTEMDSLFGTMGNAIGLSIPGQTPTEIGKGLTGAFPLGDIASGVIDPATLSGKGDEFFGTPIPYETPDGKVAYGVTSKSGRFKPIDLPEGSGYLTQTKEIDTGTEIVTVDRFNNELSRRPKENFREAYDKRLGAQQADIDVELPARRRQAKASLDLLRETTGNMVNAADKALSLTENNILPVTGAGSGPASILPFTNARDMGPLLDTLGANTAFQALQQMRDASKTGGALGAISERELVLLQSTIASLSTAQNEQQLVAAIQRIRDQVQSSLRRVEQAYLEEFGGDTTNTTVAPDGDAPAAPPPAAFGGSRIFFDPTTGDFQ